MTPGIGDVCAGCDGVGVVGGDHEPCTSCDGTGWDETAEPGSWGRFGGRFGGRFEEVPDADVDHD